MPFTSMPAVNGAPELEEMNGVVEEPPHNPSLDPIAIVGFAGRFPGKATNAKNLWDMCCQGQSAWSEVPKDRFNAEAYFHPNHSKSGCVREKLSQDLDVADLWNSSTPEVLIFSKRMSASLMHRSSTSLPMRQRYFSPTSIGHDVTDKSCKAMDPQQRLLLETTYEALENGISFLHHVMEEKLSAGGSRNPAQRPGWYPDRSLCRGCSS